MKALFVSDNHGDRAILQKIAARFGNEVDIMCIAVIQTLSQVIRSCSHLRP